MEITPAYVDVAVKCWQAETGKDATLDGDGRTFVEMKTERKMAVEQERFIVDKLTSSRTSMANR